MATYTTTRKKIRSEVNSQVYTGPHNGLAGRDAANAHPMQSITGLEAELASIQSHIGDVDIHYAMDQISITESQISDLQAYLTEEADPVFLSQKGVANGVAELDAQGKVPVGRIPDLPVSKISDFDPGGYTTLGNIKHTDTNQRRGSLTGRCLQVHGCRITIWQNVFSRRLCNI